MVDEVRKNASAKVRRRGRERGQALVEFALIMPLFVLLLMGIIQFGLALNFWLDMQRLANQGARWAVVNQWPADPDGGGPKLGMSEPCLSDPKVTCTQTLQAYLKAERISGGLQPCVNITFPNVTKAIGDPVMVEVKAPLRFLKMPFVVLPGINIGAKATMRLEQTPMRYGTGVGAGTGGTTC
ncbi:MAG: pilus assembly protein [Actinobacteria bacterium]|nr:pilus assembly protein [Actinomycetota bacterium]